MEIRESSFFAKNGAIQADCHHFYAKIAMLGRIGKGSNERLAGSDFHPVGETNVAGGSHVKILNPMKIMRQRMLL